MEARWLQRSWKDEGYTFLGGTNDFDLWLDCAKDVRVVTGPNMEDWDWFYWSQPRDTYEWGSDDMDKDRDKMLGEALTYLRIFAPWVEEEMTLGYRNYHGG